MSRRLALAALASATAVASSLALTAGDGASAAVGKRSVTVNQVYKVPDSGVFTVRGHGWGHGHGMSQHGAQGMGLKGINAQRILAFYYPGTERTVDTNGLIRVLISGDTTDPVAVVSRSGLTLRDLGDSKTYLLPTDLGAKRWRVLASTAATDKVQWYDGSVWKDWKAGGTKTALVGRGEFFSTAGPVTLLADAGPMAYRGTLRSAAPSETSTARNTVNVLTLDSYVKGVIPAEMPASWHKYAVRAQAVAARTYAAYDRAAHTTRYYDTCDTTACQVYKGVALEDPRSNDAADKTAGQIRTVDGQPIFSQFSSSNGGWTSQGTADGVSVGYLPHKADPYDGWSGNTNYSWSTKLSAAKIRSSYPAVGKLLRIRVIKREGGGDWQGRVEWLVLEGANATRTISGDEFRSRFGLKSTWFRF
jgi:SpoIID/LytB domain protein